MQTKSFINKWWNSNAPLGLEVEEWINNSYLGDEAFWKEAVFSLQEGVLPLSQSDFGKAYNFYHDCILRHVKTNKIAFSVVTGTRYPENWTYEKIHNCVNYHVDKWASDQPLPQESIAIVGVPNIHFVIALLTAFRFGLKILYLPTNSSLLGKGQILQFLSELKPKFIVAEDSSFLQEGMMHLRINENGSDDENYEPRSYAYPAASECQTGLSLLKQEPLKWVSLDSHKTYLHALRDGLLTFNLIEHAYFAAPLACPIQNEPCSTLMTLLSGATKVYIADDLMRKNPRLIEDERIHLLGLSNALQQLWNQEPGLPARYLKCIYKSPLDTMSQGWRSFLQFNKLEKVPHFDVVMDNSIGGAVLFSRPTLDPYNVFVKPTLGTSWYLSHLNGSGQESLTGFGLFEIEDSEEGNFTANHMENHLLLTGVIEPARLGVTFPIQQLEENVAELPFVEDCVVHPLSKAGSYFSHYFVLLVFVDPLIEDLDSEKWTEEIKNQIVSTLGSGYLPDKIEYLPLVPRKNIAGVDRNWCISQYNSGLLLQKKNLSQYKLLGSLKKLIQEDAKTD